MDTLPSISTGLLAGWLFGSGWLKLRSPDSFRLALAGLPRVSKWSRALLIAVLAAELSIAAGLLVAPSAVMFYFAGLLFLSFTAFLVLRWRVVAAVGCGCGGQSKAPKSVLWLAATRLTAGLVAFTVGLNGGLSALDRISVAACVAMIALVITSANGVRVRGGSGATQHRDQSWEAMESRTDRRPASRRAVLKGGFAALTALFTAGLLGRELSAALGDDCSGPNCCGLYYCRGTLCDPGCFCVGNEHYEQCVDVCTGSGAACGSPYLVYLGPCGGV